MYVKTVDQGNGGPVHVYVVVVILQIRTIIIPIYVLRKLRFYC